MTFILYSTVTTNNIFKESTALVGAAKDIDDGDATLTPLCQPLPQQIVRPQNRDSHPYEPSSDVGPITINNQELTSSYRLPSTLVAQ